LSLRKGYFGEIDKSADSLGVFDDKVDFVIIFKVIEELDDIVMVETVHDFDFSLDLLNHSTSFQSFFIHLFDSINHS